MSGTSESPSTLRIRGSNFSNTGQTLRCMFADDFGINATTLATAISDTLLTCQVCLAFGTPLEFSLVVLVGLFLPVLTCLPCPSTLC